MIYVALILYLLPLLHILLDPPEPRELLSEAAMANRFLRIADRKWAYRLVVVLLALIWPVTFAAEILMTFLERVLKL
ncbi:hypothetical protein [Poseidonocella sp. HB161398]|uniref:hypothetical protein n=1 Tax=Poseidonocella sp. HB161398 TaxID=2320855 RepID=UPI001107B759|nr:hypothetical protein [Poseidonocella sp. HB161398]